MSQVNIESLLQMQPIQPNVSPVQIQADYRTSQFSGGQIQLGQAAQQIGPSSEAAMFGALAEIAGGVGKGIDIFSSISSSIEKEKVNKAETYFDEISTKEDLTPDQKQNLWDEYLRDVYTPITGETWKSRLNNQMAKQWTSTQARNQYESQRYEKDYNEWKRKPENIGRPETNELIQEFNTLYATQYPSSNNNDWFTQLTTKVNTSIDLDNAKQAAIDFEDSLLMTYRSPSKEELDAYNNSTNMEFNVNFETSYKTYFELKSKLETIKDFKQQYELVLLHMKENVLTPAQATMTAPQYKMIAERIDQIAMGKTKEIVASVNAGNITKLQQSSNLNIAANEINFETKKNIPDFLDNWTRNVGNIEPQNRFLQTANLLGTLWSGYESGENETSTRFRALPLDQQIKFIEDQFRNWYQTNKDKFKTVTGLSDTQVENMIESSKFMIINDDKRGGKFVAQTYSGINEATARLKTMSAVIPDTDKALSEYEQNMANIFGISVKSFQGLTVERTQTGINLTPTKQTYEWFKDLPPEEQKILTDRGFTAKNFTLLEDFRTKYTDLLQTLLGGKGSSTGTSGDKLPVKISSFTDGQLLGKVLGSPEVRALADTIARTPPEVLQESGSFAESARLESARYQVESQFKAFAGNLYEATSKVIESNTDPDTPLMDNPYPANFDYFYENGVMITETPSASRFLSGRQSYLDNSNSLTDAGKREYLRLRFTAQQFNSIQGGNSAEKNEFAQDAKSLMLRIGQVGIKRIMDEDPASFYAAAAIFSGLADSGGVTEASTFFGEDSEIMKATAALVVNASNTAGGILDLSPVDDPVRDGRKVKAQKHIEQFGLAMDLYFTSTAKKGAGTMNPLIPGKFNQAESINAVVGNFFTGITTSGPNDLRSEEGTNAFIQKLNLRGSTSDATKTTAEFGQALWEVTGRKLPKLNETNSALYVLVPDPNGGSPVSKQWTNMETWEKVNYYLTSLYSTNPDNVTSLFTGWFRMAQDNKNQGLMTVDLFKGTAGFLLKDVLEAKTLPGLTQPRLPRYQQTNFSTRNLPEYRFGFPLFGKTAGEQILETELVPDGLKVKRGDLFNEALNASRSRYVVNSQPVEHSWSSPGNFESRVIAVPQRDGTTKYKTERILIGEVTKEDHFVIDTYLTQPMTLKRDDVPNTSSSYEYYRRWAEMVGKTPVSEGMFNQYVKENTKSVGYGPVAYGSLAPGTTKSNIPGVDPETLVYPSLYQVMSALHKVDLTDENRSIRVDSSGNMYFDIGKKSYMVPFSRLNPPISIANYPSETEFLLDRTLLEKSRNSLTLIRKQKLFAEKEGNPVVPFILKHNLAGTRFVPENPDFGIPFKKTGESDTEAFLRLVDEARMFNAKKAQDQQKINVSTELPFGEFSYPQEDQRPMIFTPEYERELKSQESLNQSGYVATSVEDSVNKALEFVDRFKARQNSKATQEMFGANIQQEAETLLDYYIKLIETKNQPAKDLSLKIQGNILMFVDKLKERQNFLSRQQTRQQSKATQEMVTANISQETERAFMDYIEFAQEIQSLIDFKNSLPRKNAEQEQSFSEFTVEDLRRMKELREAYKKQFGGNS